MYGENEGHSKNHIPSQAPMGVSAGLRRNVPTDLPPRYNTPNTAPTPSAGILVTLEHTSTVINQAHELISCLEERLRPITRSVPEDATAGNGMDSSAEVTDVLRRQQASIRVLCERINSITQRVDL